MINALNLLWIVPVAAAFGALIVALAAANGRDNSEYAMAMKRLGRFGSLFVDYEGCPRGAMGRACMPIEEEVLLMEPVTDVDGGIWIPVNADALHELVDKYVEQKMIREKSGRDDDD